MAAGLLEVPVTEPAGLRERTVTVSGLQAANTVDSSIS